PSERYRPCREVSERVGGWGELVSRKFKHGLRRCPAPRSIGHRFDLIQAPQDLFLYFPRAAPHLPDLLIERGCTPCKGTIVLTCCAQAGLGRFNDDLQAGLFFFLSCHSSSSEGSPAERSMPAAQSRGHAPMESNTSA